MTRAACPVRISRRPPLDRSLAQSSTSDKDNAAARLKEAEAKLKEAETRAAEVAAQSMLNQSLAAMLAKVAEKL